MRYTAPMAAARYDITFTGRVQGVGFRATTVAIAQGFQVTGWVRNEPEGSVRCIAEGDAVELDVFVESIKNRMGGSIREVQISRTEATGEFDEFSVRY